MSKKIAFADNYRPTHVGRRVSFTYDARCARESEQY